MHHPRSDSNSWDEYRSKYDTFHPRGPQAVVLWNTLGNHVIRHNLVYSDDDHRFNDGFGAGSNYSFVGFPNRDSDIYGNSISHCWDDAIESEGANQNVRIWDNFVDHTFVGIAIAATSVGPLYIWRNTSARSRHGPFGTTDEDPRGVFLKAGGQARRTAPSTAVVGPTFCTTRRCSHLQKTRPSRAHSALLRGLRIPGAPSSTW